MGRPLPTRVQGCDWWAYPGDGVGHMDVGWPPLQLVAVVVRVEHLLAVQVSAGPQYHLTVQLQGSYTVLLLYPPAQQLAGPAWRHVGKPRVDHVRGFPVRGVPAQEGGICRDGAGSFSMLLAHRRQGACSGLSCTTSRAWLPDTMKWPCWALWPTPALLAGGERQGLQQTGSPSHSRDTCHAPGCGGGRHL